MSKIPVVLLSAMSGEADRIVGLELGADDYICKPFSPRELLARIRAVLRRTKDAVRQGKRVAALAYEFEGWRLDAVRRSLSDPEGVQVELTAGEFVLLQVFWSVPSRF